MRGFLNKFEKNQYMSFVTKDDFFFKIYESISNKTSDIIQGIFEKQLVYDAQYLDSMLKF